MMKEQRIHSGFVESIRGYTGLRRIAVVIVNFRTAGLVTDCLRSLKMGSRPGSSYRVIIVDNASQDGSVDYLQKTILAESWSGWVEVLPQCKNLGFAAGNNIGLRRLIDSRADDDLILLLNPDTLVQAGATEALADHFTRNPRAGLAGAQLLDAAGRVSSSGRRRLTVLSEFLSGAQLGILDNLLRRNCVSMPVVDRPTRCDWVSGAAMMVRGRTLREVGLLDEGYFLYFEEVDYCDRVRRAGWEVWHVPAARVIHLEGSSTGVGKGCGRQSPHWRRSRRRYLCRSCGVGGVLMADILFGLGRSTLAIRRLLGLRRSSAVDRTWQVLPLVLSDLAALMGGEPA